MPGPFCAATSLLTPWMRLRFGKPGASPCAPCPRAPRGTTAALRLSLTSVGRVTDLHDFSCSLSGWCSLPSAPH